MKLAHKQRKLLKLLSINCRYSNKDLAKAIGSSADTVQYQIEKLFIKKRLGNFVAIFDCRPLGYQYYHVFFRTIDGRCDFAKVKRLPFVSFIMSNIGIFDVQIIIL